MNQSSNLQWVRKIGLVLAEGTSGTGGKGIDLSSLRITFNVLAAAVESPNNAWVRVWNPSEETVSRCREEFKRVMLGAGFENGSFGTIFDGTIRQFGWGRESQTDTYLDVFSSDADLAYAYATLNQTLSGGVSQKQVRQAIAAGMNIPLNDTTVDESLAETGGVLPRGKVLFGLARNFARTAANTVDSAWYVRDGQLTFCPFKSYLPGEPIIVNMASGQIGIPEQTNQGIKVRVLLNPRINVGQRVILNNKSIAQRAFTDKNFPVPAGQYTGFQRLAKVSGRADGTYQVQVIEHHGDTRGQEWYSDLTLLAIDPSTDEVLAQ